MKMRNILSYRKTWQRFSRLFIGSIRANSSDNLDSVRISRVNDRSSTNTIDGNTIYKIGVSEFLSGADNPGKEAQSIRGDSRIPKSSDFDSNANGPLSWEEWYKKLWKFKVVFWEKNHCRICFKIRKNDPFVFF
jgi:hypothetical protein